MITLAPVEAGEVEVDLEEAMVGMMIEVVAIVTVLMTDTKTAVAAVDLEVVVEDLEAEAEVKKINTTLFLKNVYNL